MSAQGSDNRREGQGLLSWARAIAWSTLLILVLLALGGTWPLKTVATALQRLGIGLTILGLAAIGDRVDTTAERTAKLSHMAWRTMRRGGARARARTRRWWDRMVRRTRPAYISGTSSGVSSRGAVLTTGYAESLDRATLPSREWLALLDARVQAMAETLEEITRQHEQDRQDFQERLGTQRHRLRAEIIREARHGWPLVFAGLMSDASSGGICVTGRG